MIYESSPYYAGTSGDRQFLWDVKQEVGAQPPPRTSQPQIAFQPDRAERLELARSTRGCRAASPSSIPTRRAPDCRRDASTVGDDPEQLAPKAVIDWLNGRAKGFRRRRHRRRRRATWSTGKVGMTGTSYNGTIPLAAAVTGVQGSKRSSRSRRTRPTTTTTARTGSSATPAAGSAKTSTSSTTSSTAAIRRDATHCNALYRDGEFARGRDRASGDYNDFWRARDLLTKVKNIKAAVLMAHAFNDWNVVPEHSVRIYEALKGRVPLRAYFHQGGHGGAPPLEMMNKWFTRYLYGVENGVEKRAEGVDRS